MPWFYYCCRNGNLRARKIALVKPKEPKLYQGVVCSMKNQFGFIERADVVKEIFFHYSEYDGNIDDIELGDDVCFKVTHRNVSTEEATGRVFHLRKKYGRQMS